MGNNQYQPVGAQSATDIPSANDQKDNNTATVEPLAESKSNNSLDKISRTLKNCFAFFRSCCEPSEFGNVTRQHGSEEEMARLNNLKEPQPLPLTSEEQEQMLQLTASATAEDARANLSASRSSLP